MKQKTYCFTIKVVGTGTSERSAFRDAKQGFEEKLYENVYDEAEFLHDEEVEGEEDEDEDEDEDEE
jgi:hypothetical protein